MSIYKDYYKCLSVKENTKKNGENYLYLKLQNKDTIIDGYLWNNVEFYKSRLVDNGIYAVKFELDSYNKLEVLNIKNINLVLNSNYRKYGYRPSMVKMSLSKKNLYDYDQILKFVDYFNDITFDFLKVHITTNKSKYLRSENLEYRLFTLKYLKLIEQNSGIPVNIIYPFVVLLNGMKLDLDKLLLSIKDVNELLYDELCLFIRNNKAFIKKYKFIVHLIKDIQDNYIKFKMESDN
tara:strand:+ start:2358 stop:3065 length:708 start_codon:yes stop_codon:yes gene_type:complete